MVYSTLANKIRYGSEPDNPGLIRQWLDTEKNTHLQEDSIFADLMLSNLATNDRNRLIYLTQFRLLLDTICDELIASHWRECCLDHIYLPLRKFEKLANTSNLQSLVRQMHYELTMLTNHSAKTFFNAPELTEESSQYIADTLSYLAKNTQQDIQPKNDDTYKIDSLSSFNEPLVHEPVQKKRHQPI